MDTRGILRTLAEPDSRRVARPCGATAVAAGETLESAADVLATLPATSKSETAGIVVDVSAFMLSAQPAVGAVIRAPNHEREYGRDLLVRAPLDRSATWSTWSNRPSPIRLQHTATRREGQGALGRLGR